MTSALSPVRASKDSMRFSSRSFKNIRLQASLDEAKNYSDLVNVHFIRSREENHVLSTATQAYQDKNYLRKSRSTSVANKFMNRTRRIYSTKISQNPELPNMVSSLSHKAEHIPNIEHNFRESLEYKINLEQQKRELKFLINQEKKKKDKLYIQNCKHLNAIENAQKHIRTMTEESQKDNILISETQADVHDLQSQLANIDRTNRNTKRKIEQEQNTVENLSRQVHKKKCLLETQSQNLAHLKFTQSVAYKNMSNDYLLLNQRKEEKALFLNHIHMDVTRNS